MNKLTNRSNSTQDTARLTMPKFVETKFKNDCKGGVTSPTQDTEDVVAPTHYCVVCAARWVNHPDGSWSLTTQDCGPCCDNVPMDTAPIVKLLPAGSVDEWDYRKVRRSYDAEQRKAQVDRYGGILCALCDEPFEHHFSDWECRKRVVPRFKFPADRQSLSDRIDVLEGALKPFADCVDQIAADEDDEEWAKFRLLIKDYRRAAAAFKRPGFQRCPTCGGEFDEGEWNASSECPECETPIARAALHQEGIATGEER